MRNETVVTKYYKIHNTCVVVLKMLMMLCTLFIHINIIPTQQKIHLIWTGYYSEHDVYVFALTWSTWTAMIYMNWHDLHELTWSTWTDMIYMNWHNLHELTWSTWTAMIYMNWHLFIYLFIYTVLIKRAIHNSMCSNALIHTYEGIHNYNTCI